MFASNFTFPKSMKWTSWFEIIYWLRASIKGGKDLISKHSLLITTSDNNFGMASYTYSYGLFTIQKSYINLREFEALSVIKRIQGYFTKPHSHINVIHKEEYQPKHFQMRFGRVNMDHGLFYALFTVY